MGYFYNTKPWGEINYKKEIKETERDSRFNISFLVNYLLFLRKETFKLVISVYVGKLLQFVL